MSNKSGLKVIYCDVPLTIPMPFSRVDRLERDMTVKWQTNIGIEKSLTIKKGTTSDGASIPMMFWSIIGSPFLPEYRTAAWVHDEMCKLDWDVTEMSDLFFLLLKDSNVPNTKAKLMRKAVALYKAFF